VSRFYSLEAEMAALGAALLSHTAASDIVATLEPSDFWSEAHRVVFAAVQSLSQKRARVDLVTVQSELESSGKLDDVGGFTYLFTLTDYTPSAGAGAHYAEIVRNYSLKRQLEEAATKITEAAKSDMPFLDARKAAEGLLMGVGYSERGGGLEAAENAAHEVFSQIEARMRGDAKAFGVMTGFTDLDELMVGMGPGELIILAARPAMGKTSLAMQVAFSVARLQRGGSLVWSLEMPKEQLLGRMLASMSGVSYRDTQRGVLSVDEMQRVYRAGEMLSGLPLFIGDSVHLTPARIRSQVATHAAKHGPPALITVDYLQLLQPTRSSGSREVDVSGISKELKEIAIEFKCPVLALAQVNRALEARTNKRPMLSDLRESGGIEANADMVIGLYRRNYYEGIKQESEVCEAIVLKQRRGETGTAFLAFRPQVVQFCNLDEYSKAEYKEMLKREKAND